MPRMVRSMDPLDVIAWVAQPQARKLLPVANGPRVSNASSELLREIQIIDECGAHRSMRVPIERALRVRVDERELVTLWTLGACPEWLVLGYLRNQRLIGAVTTLESITVDWQSGTASVTTRQGAGEIGSEAMRQSGAAADALAHSQVTSARISRTTLLAVLESVRQFDAVYRYAGSVHGCALFQGADPWVSVEDTSRRNGVDTITGWMALHGVSGEGKVLFTTGRLTAEVVMKAAHNGISIVVSRKGVTAACCDLAGKLGMTLLGHAANRRYWCYAGAERFDVDS
jgi:FdhD protein